jgi:hypothetical protein
MCANASEFQEVLRGLREYVALRRRQGHTFTLEQAIVGHRARCLLNLLDDEDEMWKRRVVVLEEIAAAEGVSLAGQDTLDSVMEILAERFRQRRAMEVAKHRGQTVLGEPSERILTTAEMAHGHAHLRAYLASGATPAERDHDEQQLAMRPWDCDCPLSEIAT